MFTDKKDMKSFKNLSCTNLADCRSKPLTSWISSLAF
jgi:hypothetical protein